MIKRLFLYIQLLFVLLFLFLTSTSRAYAADPVCGVDYYQETATFCSVSDSGRTVVPGFTGCRVGEYCVIAAGITCSGAEGQINTAVGCIPTFDINNLSAYILRWAIGVGGGIAFLLMVYAGFMIMSSTGNPERLKAGQELLTSAIAGLIMLIFSVFVLRIIGINILDIPGFGG